MNFILKAYCLQDIGERQNQEDTFYPPLIDPCHFDESAHTWSFYDGTAHMDDRLFIVCDGMGGHERGEEASRIAVQTLSQSLLASAPVEGLFNDDLLRQAVDDTVKALHEAEDEKEVRKMGTTMALLKFHCDGATVGHIGDSRVYQFRPARNKEKARMLFCTEDHTLLGDLIRSGKASVLDKRNSLFKHTLTRVLIADKHIHPEAQIDHITDIEPGDIFLLCSDGLYENLTDEQLCSILCDPNYGDEQLAQRLLRASLNHRDNHTAYIVRVHDVLNKNQTSGYALSPGTLLQSEKYTYHIEKELGQGAFGITYLVSTDVTMRGGLGTVRSGVRLALKEFFMREFMKREGSAAQTMDKVDVVKHFEKKFREEAKKLAMLSHPNIVKVLEVFEANNTVYYSMEYMPDGCLTDYVFKRDGLPEQEALACIRQIGSALKYLHLNKMLHLDVKPGNVMRNEETGLLKLIDFGLAHRIEGNTGDRTSANIGGTKGFAPLEQMAGDFAGALSPQMDVYALGASYYKILTATTPPAAVSVLNDGLNVHPLERKHVSKQSIDAIRAAMQPIVANRLKTVEDFLNMLPRVDDETIFHPSLFSQKKVKWLVAIVTLLAIVGIGFLLHLLRA